jgi:hypothetical protein
VPVEREALVLRVAAQAVWVRPLAACAGCLGCGGRCDLYAGLAEDAGVRLPRQLFGVPPEPGQRLRLSWQAPALHAVALRAYGLPLAGLLLGALGMGWLNLGPRFADLGVLFGAVAGTLLGIALSKRAMAAARGLRVLPASSPAGSDVAAPAA